MQSELRKVFYQSVVPDVTRGWLSHEEMWNLIDRSPEIAWYLSHWPDVHRETRRDVSNCVTEYCLTWWIPESDLTWALLQWPHSRTTQEIPE